MNNKIVTVYRRNGKVELEPPGEEIRIELQQNYDIFKSATGQVLIYGVAPYGMTVEQAEMWGAVTILA